jgi:hypothetical protein
VARNTKSTPGPAVTARPDGLAGRAALVLDALAGLEPELKAAAVLSDQGEVLASTNGDEAWGRFALDLVHALETAGAGELDSSHVTTPEAEIFTVAESGFALVAVTARFVLASLTSFDIRMSLRDLAAEMPEPAAGDA